ncbi:unnamed protein product, partial [Discosporangium mesarthrocarpum]
GGKFSGCWLVSIEGVQRGRTMARRLQKELEHLKKNRLEWCEIEPMDEDILKWTAMLVGPEGTPFNGGCFNLEIQFPTEYPFKAPKASQVKFVTRIYHPNVKTDTGEICSDILNNNWGPTLNVTYVLNTIRQQMLQEPHADNPLEADIARQLSEDKNAFNATAKKWTLDYASP